MPKGRPAEYEYSRLIKEHAKTFTKRTILRDAARHILNDIPKEEIEGLVVAAVAGLFLTECRKTCTFKGVKNCPRYLGIPLKDGSKDRILIEHATLGEFEKHHRARRQEENKRAKKIKAEFVALKTLQDRIKDGARKNELLIDIID